MALAMRVKRHLSFILAELDKLIMFSSQKFFIKRPQMFLRVAFHESNEM